MAKKKVRRLKDIETNEVSLVEGPANELPFLFFKQKGKPDDGSLSKQKTKLTIGIESDGTAKGTKVTINGDAMKDLRDFNFSFYGGMSTEKDNPICCSYSKVVEATDGFKRTESFYLSKGDFKVDKLKELVKKYIGDDSLVFEKAILNDTTTEALTSSMEIIAGYQEDFPEDLQKAIGVIAKQVVDSAEPSAKEETEETEEEKNKDKTEEENKETIQKAGAKFSGATLKKIQSVIVALKELEGLLPQEKSKTAVDAEDGIQKVLTGLAKSIDELKGSNLSEELKKSLDGISERLKTVEETTGIKKSIEGQEAEEKGEKETGEKKWPSLTSKRTT